MPRRLSIFTLTDFDAVILSFSLDVFCHVNDANSASFVVRLFLATRRRGPVPPQGLALEAPPRGNPPWPGKAEQESSECFGVLQVSEFVFDGFRAWKCWDSGCFGTPAP